MTTVTATRVHARAGERKWVFRWTYTRSLLLGFAAIGVVAMAYRLVFGMGAATNLTNKWPWGLWVWWDVMTGVALAGGGYSTALMVNFLGREKWRDVERAALLTSLIGYLMVVGGLFMDLGRWINVWQVPLIWRENIHSIMFELVWCVTGYTVVQIVEFGHIFVERVHMPRLAHVLHKIYVPTLIIGVMLPFMHQSALGSLYLIAGGRLDPLWWTLLLPLFFLMSSFFVGPAMVTVENTLASKARGHLPPKRILTEMVRVTGFLMVVYLILKVADLIHRGQFNRLFDGSVTSTLWLIEVGFGIVIPMVIFLRPRLRNRTGWLVTGATLTVLGVALNRANVVFTGMMGQANGATYVPSLGELAITAGIVSIGVLVYCFVMDNFPVAPEGEEGTAASAGAVSRSRPYIVFVPKQRIAPGDEHAD